MQSVSWSHCGLILSSGGGAANNGKGLFDEVDALCSIPAASAAAAAAATVADAVFSCNSGRRGEAGKRGGRR